MEHYFTNNNDLKSELRVINYSYKDFLFSFYSDNGVFSKNKVDFGSSLLIEEVLKSNNKKSKILDVGCGYGVIGITLGKVTDSYVDFVDVNKRSVHLTQMNIEKNKIDGTAFVSDSYEEVKGKYDLIVTNPPIRAGKSIVLDILINANKYLKKDGVLWFVIRKDQGALSTNKILEEYYNVNIMKKSKGYFIFNATKKC